MKKFALLPGFVLIAVLLALAFSPVITTAAPALANEPAASPAERSVVLAAPDSPYYTLATEIAAAEGLKPAHSLPEALAEHPVYLLWVATPSELSDPAMIALGQAVKAQPQPVAVGIITGSDLEKARQLWQRAGQARGNTVVVANAASDTANVAAEITQLQGPTQTHLPLSKESLAASLQQADYLVFNGHGSGSGWMIDPADSLKFSAADVPALGPIVVSADSCQTLRPWVEDSLALRFVDQGAALYAGFVYSPIAGYQLGEYGGLVLHYTWPEFTVGEAMLVQQEGYQRGFSNLPFYFALGDPRIALQAGPPYQVLEDKTEGNARVIHFSAAPAGFLPVRIAGGASYSYVQIPGEATADDRDAFYNSQIQMVNIGEDKYILFNHHGGEFTLRLQPRQPLLRLVTNPLLDVLDHSLVFIQQGLAQTMVFILLQSLITLIVLRLNPAPLRRLVWTVGIAGWAAFSLHGLYVILRQPHLTIISKVVKFNPLMLLVTFLAVATGAYLYLTARTSWKKALAVLEATWVYLAAALFNLGAPAVINVMARSRIGGAIYNYRMGWINLIAFAFFCLVLALAYQVIQQHTPLPQPEAEPAPPVESESATEERKD